MTKKLFGRLKAACAARVLPLLLLLALPPTVQAQDYTCTTNKDNTITINKYTGAGGAVTIPGAINGLPVISIGQQAFDNCAKLTSVTLPGSVTSIDKLAFTGCKRLKGITVDADNASYSSVDGVLFDKNRTTLVQCPVGRTGSYTIPAGVTRIGDSAFILCTNLSSVSIGSGVTSIGSWAFAGCDRLKGITVDAGNASYSSVNGVLFDKNQTTLIQYPAGKTGGYTLPAGVTRIGDSAFRCCAGLTSVMIPGSLTSISDEAFGYCIGLTGITIPNSITNIGFRAFYNCTNLASITIPVSVTRIGSWAFSGCDRLKGITVDAGNASYSSMDGVLFDKNQTTLIRCPGGKAGGYTLPASVTRIGDSAFSDCAKLTNITISVSVTSIGGWAFSGCSKLTSITIPKSVTSIWNGAFNRCVNLTSIYFKGNAPSLGNSKVISDTNKATVYYLPGTTGWGPAFGGCPAMFWKK
jgi:hypothetical protein